MAKGRGRLNQRSGAPERLCRLIGCLAERKTDIPQQMLIHPGEGAAQAPTLCPEPYASWKIEGLAQGPFHVHADAHPPAGVACRNHSEPQILVPAATGASLYGSWSSAAASRFQKSTRETHSEV
jgi:hypothetical protein